VGDIRSRELMIFQRLKNRAVTIELSPGERLVGLRNEGGCFLRLAEAKITQSGFSFSDH
jgi:hypothetical protein